LRSRPSPLSQAVRKDSNMTETMTDNDMRTREGYR